MATPLDSDDLLSALREAGARITKPRKLIIQILADRGDEHPDAMEIFRRATFVGAQNVFQSRFCKAIMLKRFSSSELAGLVMAPVPAGKSVPGSRRWSAR